MTDMIGFLLPSVLLFLMPRMFVMLIGGLALVVTTAGAVTLVVVEAVVVETVVVVVLDGVVTDGRDCCVTVIMLSGTSAVVFSSLKIASESERSIGDAGMVVESTSVVVIDERSRFVGTVERATKRSSISSTSDVDRVGAVVVELKLDGGEDIDLLSEAPKLTNIGELVAFVVVAVVVVE